ncbi:uncharacterized protein LOC143037852 [Oratosquilla oratoria]|uniref:uncharacterized protein LOC143037852 n=1 Tax=Oratosquilla oratoria TaxID=337810 RepID=UPI003F758966
MAQLQATRCIVASLKKSSSLGVTINSASRVSVNSGLNVKEKFGCNGIYSLQPLEAKLSALAVSQPDAFVSSYNNIYEYRLPACVKDFHVTLPTLYQEGILEKEMPHHAPLVDQVEPYIPPAVQESPTIMPVIEKQAARLIVIRRKKMKKHKLRKLRKKMKFVWLKIIQKREYKKEKDFQAEQMAKIRKAEAFDAEEYVARFLQETKEKPIPKFWRGKRLPRDIIKQLMKEKK